MKPSAPARYRQAAREPLTLRGFKPYLVALFFLALGGCSHQLTRSNPDWLPEWRERFGAGKAAVARGDTSTAEQEFRAALEIARSEKPPGLATALCLNALGKLWTESGQLEQAEPAMAEAVAIFESRVGTKNEQFAILLTNRGDVAFKQGRFADAGADFQRALEITERLSPVPEDLRERTRTMLVGSLCRQGRLTEGDAVGKKFGMKCRRDDAVAPKPEMQPTPK